MSRTHLVIIDPQNDFCHPDGSLFVPGAPADMERLASMIRRLAGELDAIHVTLDTHQRVDISHPMWWVDADGNHPAPFSSISADDVASGRWRTFRQQDFKRSVAYLQQLQARGRYDHTIWPEHCLEGSFGHAVYQPIFDAIAQWERRYATTDYVRKGTNAWTEHFSAFQAEVPDSADPSTQLNRSLIAELERADRILIAGEARSHCVANSVRDLAAGFENQEHIKKITLLIDATSDVPDPPGSTLFTQFGERFVADLQSLGMQIATTDSLCLP